MKTHRSRQRKAATRTPATKPARIPNPGIHHLLVPLDFSGKSRQALKYAVPLARHFQARISLLHVVEPVYLPAEAGGLIANLAEDINEQRRDAAKHLAQMSASLVPAAVRGRNLVGIGSARELIVDAVRRQRIDLVVLSTKGRSGLARMVLGSTAEYVVRHAPCPVFSVRRQ